MGWEIMAFNFHISEHISSHPPNTQAVQALSSDQILKPSDAFWLY